MGNDGRSTVTHSCYFRFGIDVALAVVVDVVVVIEIVDYVVVVVVVVIISSVGGEPSFFRLGFARFIDGVGVLQQSFYVKGSQITQKIHRPRF